jgi:hypothetical protein
MYLDWCKISRHVGEIPRLGFSRKYDVIISQDAAAFNSGIAESKISMEMDW